MSNDSFMKAIDKLKEEIDNLTTDQFLSLGLSEIKSRGQWLKDLEHCKKIVQQTK